LSQYLQPNSRLLGIALQKDITLLDISFSYIFFYAKKVDLQHHAGHVTSIYISFHICLVGRDMPWSRLFLFLQKYIFKCSKRILNNKEKSTIQVIDLIRLNKLVLS
jgi:hypothetical protein